MVLIQRASQSYSQPSVMLIRCASPELFSTQYEVDPVCVPIDLFSTQCGVDPVCAPRAILNPVSVPIDLFTTQCYVDPVCVHTVINNPAWYWSGVRTPELFSTQCDIWSSERLLRANLNPVWCWSSMCHHREIVNFINLHQPSVMFDPVCVPIEHLQSACDADLVCHHRAIVNLLQPSAMLTHYVTIKLLSTCFNPVQCWSSVCPLTVIVNLLQSAATWCDFDQMYGHIELRTYIQPESQCVF